MKNKLKVLLLIITIFSFNNVYAETINFHSTSNHTKKEIIDKYNNSLSKFNYNTSMYKEEPNFNNPYKEGSLKEEVENDVLNKINYYRWLQGLNDISINSDRQSFNQKGAFIMRLNNYLSHRPSKPNGMDDSFYNDGYSACGSKSNTYQGNIAMGIRIDNTPEAFITDDSNMEANVAHRSSLLKPDATAVSFGYVDGYSTMSIYYNGNNNNSETFYPWPSAGYFPLESMIQNANTRWSMYIGYYYNLANDTRVVLTHNNQEYVVNRSNIGFVDYNRTLYYSLPSELKNSIASNSRFKASEKVNVRVENLVKNSSTYTINYDVEFFSVKEREIQKIELNKKETTLEVGDEEYLSVTITPSDNVDKTIRYESSDNSIVTVDKEGRIEGINEGTATITASSSNGKTSTCTVTVKKATPGVAYTTHVQNIGWQNYVKNGEMAGTSGRSLRLEGIKIKLKDLGYSGSIEYRTHIQNIGWETSFKRNGEMSGTSGRSLRLEGIEIKLTGNVSKYYDVYYRVHAENFGWMGWARNGEDAGTAGYAFRLEGIEIKLVEKGKTFSEYGKQLAFRNKDGSKTPEAKERKTKVTYTTHVEYIGWQDYVSDGKMAGTSGKSLRLEGIKIRLDDKEYNGNILYRTHIQNIGWETDFKQNDQMSGTSGRSLRLEAIEIKLDGEISEYYDIYYRVHAQNFGWLGWARNGEQAGTAGYAYRLEGIEIKLVEKGKSFPEYGKTKAFREK